MDLSRLDGELGYVEGEVFRVGRMHQDGFLHEYADLFSALVCHAFRLEQELVEAAYRGHSFRRAAEGFGQYDEREAQRVEEGEDDECELGAEAVDAGDVRSEDDERDDWRRPEDEAEVQRFDEALSTVHAWLAPHGVGSAGSP